MKRIITIGLGFILIGCGHFNQNTKYPECWVDEKVVEIRIQDWTKINQELKSVLNKHNKKVDYYIAVSERWSQKWTKDDKEIVELAYPNEFEEVKNTLGFNSELKDFWDEHSYDVVSEVTLYQVETDLAKAWELIEEKKIKEKKAFKELDKGMDILRQCYKEAKEQRYKEAILDELRAIRLHRIGILNIEPNAYGLGVNMDEYGRPTTYRLRDGKPLSPIFYDGVKRNAYGPGVHMDQFGRPVYDSLK